MPCQVDIRNCPMCGTPLNPIETNPTCESCGRPLLITNYDTVHNMSQADVSKYANAYRAPLAEHPDNGALNLSAAFCFLRLRLYDQAEKAFERAMTDDMNNAELYFYAAVTQLKGKRPFLAGRAAILRAEEYVDAALRIQAKGIYYYFLSYVKYDFYFNKRLRTTPTYQEALQASLRAGLTTREVTQLYETLGTAKPACL